MAKPKKDNEDEAAVEPAAEPVEEFKLIKFTAFKVYTSRGRRLAGDVDTFAAEEADKLVADGHAIAWQ